MKVKGNCGDDGYSEETTTVSFTTDETHYWNEGNTWPGGEVPADYIDVEITTNVIIAADSTVYAGNVTIENGGSLTMEPGARFYHSNEVPVNVQMNVEGYDTNAKDGDGGYKLIASPIDPSVFVPSTHLVDNYDDYDLYLFDQSGDGEGNQWLNYKQGEFDSLYITKGYLYANTENVLAVFAGPTKPTNEDVTVNLDYDADAPYELAGWNLIGNPFTCIAYIDHDMYIMNPDGDEIISVTNQLPKIQLNPNHTKVYNARTADYANRFKLVFATETTSVSENFAFFNNGNLLVNNEGKATVQVIDLNGRILSSETINGCASININGAAGVYMVRLINGNDVKVQKVIVR